MATLPPEVGQIEDRSTAAALTRLYEIIDDLEARLAVCEADLATVQASLATLSSLETDIRQQRDRVIRVL